jgi:hypothetical protein
MIWLLLLVSLTMGVVSLLLLCRMEEDDEYERTLRRRRWRDY